MTVSRETLENTCRKTFFFFFFQDNFSSQEETELSLAGVGVCHRGLKASCPCWEELGTIYSSSASLTEELRNSNPGANWAAEPRGGDLGYCSSAELFMRHLGVLRQQTRSTRTATPFISAHRKVGEGFWTTAKSSWDQFHFKTELLKSKNKVHTPHLLLDPIPNTQPGTVSPSTIWNLIKLE